MSKSKTTIYPPGEILNPILGKTDYEYIILWMLNNNYICEWSDFTAEISESTLSGHLRKLKIKGYIEKPEKAKYMITSTGRERFRELSYDKKAGKRRLKYPPKVIMKRRNYDHWILWMVYNNYSCKWSDFKQEPLSINQSSLSNNLNSLLENGFIVRENKEYVITQLGKTEYFTILKSYDMDRQSILNEESKRIEEITEKTRDFFQIYKIEDDELKFRYLDLILKLNYSKVESMLKNEDDFNKIMLFLSFNHPNQYPDYISTEDFSLKYNIDATTLNYYIREIVDKNFFQIKFFKLEDKQGRIYYFQKGEPIEKILNAIVEKYITKLTYLNKFREEPTIDLELLLDNIIDDICDKLFNINLKPSIKNFLPDYIKYLAYKIEIEKSLVDNEAKLEGFVWQNIFEEFQTFEPSSQPIGTIDDDEPFYSLDKRFFDVLDVVYLSKLNFLMSEEVQDTYEIKKQKIFDDIGKLLYRNKLTRARDLFEANDYELSEINQLILEDIIATSEKNFDESIKITTQIIDKFSRDFIGYLFQSLTYFLMDDYEKALSLVDKGLKKAPNILLICQKVQILSKIEKYEKALEFLEDALLTHPNHIFLLRIKCWIHINEWYWGIKEPEKTWETINSAIKLNPKDKELKILKSMIYCKIDRFREAKRFLSKEIDINIFKKNPRIHIATFFIFACSYLARGKFGKALKISNQIIELYPNHPQSYFTKAMVLGYNVIYKFKVQESNIEAFLDLIKKAISIDSIKSYKAKYLVFQGYVFLNIKEYEKAVETIDKAIEINPNHISPHRIKIYFLTNTGKTLEALELIEETVNGYPEYKIDLYKMKSIIYWNNKNYEKSYEVIDEITKFSPRDRVDIINNKVLLLARLKKKEDAIEAAEYLITIDPNQGNSYDTYGEVLQIFGEYEEAIKKYEEALRVEPKGWFSDQTFIRMGECYEELGMYEKALESYKTGKILEERHIPTYRDFFGSRADKRFSELRTKMNRLKKENNS
ncbi:MAG: tetratricopeptide repeat protein [Candidatus Thorarchaeota archaeon]